jgi:hypothetical protein
MELTEQAINQRATNYFGKAYQNFTDATANAGEIQKHYLLAGYKVRLRFAGPALIPHLTPAFQHLETTPFQNPQFTVCLWDNDTTQTTMIPSDWEPEDIRERGEIRGFNSARFQTAFLHGANSFQMLDNDLNISLYRVRDADHIPFWESSAPLKVSIHWWMRNNNRQYAHAAAVGTPQGGVLLVGRGGSGKSTTALSTLHSDLSYASDDYCIVQNEPTPFVYSAYSSAKVFPETVAQFPHLQRIFGHLPYIQAEKNLYYLQQHYPHKIINGFPIKAIIVPQVTKQTQGSIQPISAVKALGALAPSSIFQLPCSGKNDFDRMAELIKKVPCYGLNLGSDLAQNANLIHQFVQSISS